MVDPTPLPPSSLLLAYWTGGAFLMGAKRLSEYRDISTEAGMQMLHRYRRSFSAYTAESLTVRSEEHTSELQSLMRISYAVFCLKKKKNRISSPDQREPNNSPHQTHNSQ